MATKEYFHQSNDVQKTADIMEQMKKDARTYTQGLTNPSKAKNTAEINQLSEKARRIEAAYIMGAWQAGLDAWTAGVAEKAAIFYRDNLALGKTHSDKQDEYQAFITGYRNYMTKSKNWVSI